MIKAVIFDFFGVICSDEYWNFVKEDKNADGDFNKLSADLNLGHISWRDFVSEVAKDTGQDIAKVRQMYESQKVHPEMVAFIGKLHERYKTALISNASTEHLAPILEQGGLKKVFNEIIISSELGIAKPDPRIFQIALARLQVEPHEAVFIDDISRYIYAAKELGINTILYDNFGQMKTELVRLLTNESGQL
ncbi:MAG: HAD-superfamily hydrolase, subfamily variant 3 [Candidatus Saccharibacteria bacterium]|nr:HAD-superfamily hydrolase, subfamily variant 3 [Candidatus Saccharibacteria bacterium]